MEKTSLIYYVISNYSVSFAVGIFILLLGVAIPLFHWYFLIAGLNTRSEEELRGMDLRYIERFVGWFTKVMGMLLFLNPFVCVYLGFEQKIPFVAISIVLIITGSVIAFGTVNRNKIYKQVR